MRMGFSTYQGRGASTVGNRRSYAWVALADRADGLRYGFMGDAIHGV